MDRSRLIYTIKAFLNTYKELKEEYISEGKDVEYISGVIYGLETSLEVANNIK